VTAEAAATLLGTSPAVLCLWEKRFGYPVAEHTEDGQRLYAEDMMIALRDALRRDLSISAAISHARKNPKEVR
jgi:DNA-binding transcriptional MerR regulator